MTGSVLHHGAELKDASGVVILLHGRGASARDILSLAPSLSDNEHLAWLAPQAEGSSWYPYSFLAPREENEPKLSHALKTVQNLVELAEAAGFERERILIGGFSQGACLSTEFVATHPARYAGLLAFTGGLIGPLGSDVGKVGLLLGTPALLASGDPDPHVPWSRVEESASVLTEMGAQVTLRRYPGRPHTIRQDELKLARTLVATAFPRA
jgi:phospholipase/carboxylesterase